MLPHLLSYFLYDGKGYIHADLMRFSMVYWPGMNKVKNTTLLLKVLLFCPEYRNIFYARVEKISRRLHVGLIMEIILPRYKFLSIGTVAERIGEGLYIEHGNSTIIHADSIGDNCWVNQNVTIGDNGRGIPKIGNNVRIGTGAVIIGPITIGDNVIIGANSTVTKDVPSNCTIIPSPSYIIRRNGQKVYEKL